MAPTNGFQGIHWLDRARASALHLLLSAMVVGLLASSMWLVWYRPPYFFIDGGWHVLRILVAVDVVLGPLLTFIVFNRAKPELRRDLAIIVVIQLCAFFYGAGTLYAHRPAFAVASDGNLFCVNWREIARAGGDLAPAEILARHAAAPAFAYANLPASRSERDAMTKAAAAGGPLPVHYARYYEAIAPPRWESLYRKYAQIEGMVKNDAGIGDELARVRAAHPSLAPDRMGFVPLSCRYGLVMLVLDRESRALLDWMN
jgi:hypothetical protein